MEKEGDYTDEKNEKSKYMLIAKEEGLHCNPAWWLPYTLAHTFLNLQTPLKGIGNSEAAVNITTSLPNKHTKSR